MAPEFADVRPPSDDEQEDVRAISVGKAANLIDLLPPGDYQQVLRWIRRSVASDLGLVWDQE